MSETPDSALVSYGGGSAGSHQTQYWKQMETSKHKSAPLQGLSYLRKEAHTALLCHLPGDLI
jgi:hypothetical protein